MILAGRDTLEKFIRKHASSRSALQAWVAETETTVWRGPQDIRNRYRSADFLSGNRVIFNIKGNDFRLVVKVGYEGGIVLVEWIGTHAEYSKHRF